MKHIKTPQELNEASENLNISDVINQRELLIAFAKHRNKTNCDIITELDIDNFLEAINSL